MEVNIQNAYTIALEEIKNLTNEVIIYKSLNIQQQEEINNYKLEIDKLKKDKNKNQ
ncbi:hypothetical protein [Clostridioides difficile]|uniref:hypothetical protein n=1 Tax=Clostridioides difficile TaxID=1496 RepID=UPI000A58C9B9|nr:hypothetical protein [Clostridioides difficile]MCJ0310351.1 hypothetical protein [Clostridioides difficile]MCJ0377625.1 hypothetical protein [Clostridioides difficile]MCJ0410808.1 hypothetical protein [Clostridioides difficile]MCO8703356.1 hypothetical protein [Clostridioides difficile]HBE9553498.1 hypothetical protein [Clostridioides difficile]